MSRKIATLIGARIIGSGSVPTLEYLIRDDYTDTVVAGSVNGTSATPGPGTRVVVDTESKLSLSSGYMNMAPKATPATGDPRIHYTVGGAGLSRATGLCIMGLARPTATNTSLRLVGWDNNTTGDAEAVINLNAVASFGNESMGMGVGYIANEWAYGALVLRSSGYHYLVKGAGKSELATWSRLWVKTTGGSATLYPSAINQSATYTQDYMRVAQLASPWTNNEAGGTVLTSPAASTAFTHPATCLLYFTVTLPASDEIDLRFRIQDANNYWKFTIDASGNGQLFEVVSGTPTQRGATATGITNGMRVCIRASNATIYYHKGEASGTAYTTTLYGTNTNGVVQSLGTGGAISSLEIYAWELSGSELSQIEAMNHSTFPGWQINNASMSLASSRLTVPNGETGGNANQVVHPSVYDAGDGNTWNGHRYWMVVNPYPESDETKENPWVLVSDDLDTWIEPESISNPLVANPGGGVYNSDPDIIRIGDDLYIIYRESDGSTYDKIKEIHSSDGITWSSPVEIIAAGNAEIVSPSIIWNGSQFEMYSLSVPAGYKIQRRTCSTLTGTWGDATTISTLRVPLSETGTMWHLDVYFDATYKYIAMVTIHTTADYYFLAESQDGDVWRVAENRLVSLPSSGWDNGWLYRACFAGRTATGFDIVYSAKSDDGLGDWGIGLTSLMIGVV